MNKENAFSNKHKILAFTLTLLTFVMGTSEFVIVGLLTEVSTDLSIPIATAGSWICYRLCDWYTHLNRFC